MLHQALKKTSARALISAMSFVLFLGATLTGVAFSMSRNVGASPGGDSLSMTRHFRAGDAILTLRSIDQLPHNTTFRNNPHSPVGVGGVFPSTAGNVFLEFGSYPRSFVGTTLDRQLEQLYQQNSPQLRATGRSFTSNESTGMVTSAQWFRDNTNYAHRSGEFIARVNPEFEFERERFVRLDGVNRRIANTPQTNAINPETGELLPRGGPDNEQETFINPAATTAQQTGLVRWFRVEPIRWVIANWNNLPLDINPTPLAQRPGGVMTEIHDDMYLLSIDQIMSGIPHSGTATPFWRDSAIRAFLNGMSPVNPAEIPLSVNSTNAVGNYNSPLPDGVAGPLGDGIRNPLNYAGAVNPNSNPFVHDAFTVGERSLINITQNGNQPITTANAYNANLVTYDRVFLLGRTHAGLAGTANDQIFSHLFPNDTSRIAKNTDWAFANFGWAANNSAARWWLRSPFTATDLSAVSSSGVLSSFHAFFTSSGLRPALSLSIENLESTEMTRTTARIVDAATDSTSTRPTSGINAIETARGNNINFNMRGVRSTYLQFDAGDGHRISNLAFRVCTTQDPINVNPDFIRTSHQAAMQGASIPFPDQANPLFNFRAWFTQQDERDRRILHLEIYNADYDDFHDENRLTVIATAQLIDYNIRFHNYALHGARLSANRPTQYQINAPPTLPTFDYVPQGQRFLEWRHHDINGEAIPYTSIPPGTYGDLDLFAVWEFQIYFQMLPGRGSHPPEPIWVTQGDFVPTGLRGPLVDPIGESFAGWATDSGGHFPVQHNVPVTQPMILFPIFTPIENEIRIQVNLNADTYNPATFNGLPQSGIPVFNATIQGLFPSQIFAATINRPGYRHIGWQTAFGQNIDSASRVQAGMATITLYAQWERVPNGVRVNLDPMGGTLPGDNFVLRMVGDLYFNLPILSPPPGDGIEFLGWFTAVNGGTEITATTRVTNGSTHTIFARWFTPGDRNLQLFFGDGRTDFRVLPFNTEIIERLEGTTNVQREIARPTRNGFDFQGWYTTANFAAGTRQDFPFALRYNTVLHARWTPMTITVSYDFGLIQLSYIPQTVTFDDFYTPESLPHFDIEGFDFLGWWTHNGAGGNWGTQVTTSTRVTNFNDHTLFARFEPLGAIVVTFNPNGGRAPSFTSTEVTFSQPYGTLPTIQRTGFAFMGWFTTQYGGTQVIPTTEVRTVQNHTLFARWQAIPAGQAGSIQIVLHPGIGATLPPPGTMQFSAMAGSWFPGLPSASREGYRFDGWYWAARSIIVSTSTLLDIGPYESTTINLHARWAEVGEVTVSFNTNGGTPINPRTAFEGGFVTRPADPTRPGFNFAGWFTSQDFTTEFNFFLPLWDSTTVYARWTGMSLLVTQRIMSPENRIVGTFNVLYRGNYPSLIPAPDEILGYTFVGWFFDSLYSNPVLPNQLVTLQVNHNIYARFIPATITVTLNANGGILAESPTRTLTFNTQYGDLPTPTREGAIFYGWWTTMTGGVRILPTTLVTNPNNHNLFARWVADPAGIRVNLQAFGGDLGGHSGFITVLLYENYPHMDNLPLPVRPGFFFVGWFTHNVGGNGDGQQISNNIRVTNGSTHSIFARWVEIEIIHLHFVTTSDFMPSQEVYAGERPTTPTNPTRTGHSFAGWYTCTDFISPFNFFEIMLESTTIYARWNVLSFRLTFNTNTAAPNTVVTIAFNSWIANSVSEQQVRPTRDGYIFMGWRFADDTLFSFMASMPANDFTVFADWVIDIARLHNAIAQARGYVAGNERFFTADSIMLFNQMIAFAEQVYSPYVTAADITSAIRLLEDSRGILVLTAAVIYDLLDQQFVRTRYTTSTWNFFQNSINNARNDLEMGNLTITNLQDIERNLNLAISNLRLNASPEVQDKAELFIWFDMAAQIGNAGEDSYYLLAPDSIFGSIAFLRAWIESRINSTVLTADDFYDALETLRATFVINRQKFENQRGIIVQRAGSQDYWTTATWSAFIQSLNGFDILFENPPSAASLRVALTELETAQQSLEIRPIVQQENQANPALFIGLGIGIMFLVLGEVLIFTLARRRRKQSEVEA